MSVAITLILGYTAYLGFRIGQTWDDQTQRRRDLGISLAAVGVVVSLVGSMFFDTLAKSGLIGDLFYQQIHFPILYLGFALVLVGIDAVSSSVNRLKGSAQENQRWNRIRILIGLLYILSVVVSALYLLNPATYTITFTGASQHVAQQQIFFLPLFLTLVVGTLSLPLLAFISGETASRRQLFWFGLFAGLLLIGMLREATITPSSGDPLIDLLMAFGPFTIGSFCLYLSLRALILDKTSMENAESW